MSLINQMLRDLDARSGHAANAPVVASHASGPVRPRSVVGQSRLALTASALLAGALLTLISVQKDQDNPEHFSGAEWAPLALPEPTPRSRSTLAPRARQQRHGGNRQGKRTGGACPAGQG
jgi:hypothetical protein